jgi:3-oxoacyl-[acyl-carrier protein] reductase
MQKQEQNSNLPFAIVTGASRGIGAAIAKRLAKDGRPVLLNYTSATSESKAQALMDEIVGSGGKAAVARFDVSQSSEVDAAFSEWAEKWGPIGVLVNNAGIAIDGLLLRLKDEDLDRMLDVDLKGAIYCTRAATKSMMRAKKGSVIQIASVIGEMGNAGQSAYSAAKAGLIGFTKSVARELSSRNIRVNAITPGFIGTEMTGALTEAQKEAILRSIPLGFIGSPDDVADLVSFLASDQSRYITGQVIGINGGLYI